MRYLIKFSYDGKKFHGFQRQKNVKNVQSTLENALSEALNETILIKGSGRTDAGVHAKCQCASFDIKKNIKPYTLKGIKIMLKNEIVIKKLRRVNDNFHARHNVKEKTYVYKIYNAKYNSNYEGYYYQIAYKLDLKKMRQVGRLLIGTHDYHNFVSGIRDNYVSTIFDIKLKKRGNFITLTFRGVGFYRYMVRHLVGAIIDVGRGRATIDEVNEMLDFPDKHKNLSVVPADGLYLWRIKY